MTQAETEQSDVLSLELILTVVNDRKNRTAISKIASELKFEPREGDTHLLEGSVLPEDDAETFFLWLHIDPLDFEDAGTKALKNRKRLIVHMKYSPKPKSAPPARIRSAWKRGVTVEKVQHLVESMLNREAFPLYGGVAELRLRGWQRRKPAVVALPLTIGTDVLNIAGAEYRSEKRSPPKREGATSVQRFRYADQLTHIDVWLEYTAWFARPFRPWHTLGESWEPFLRSAI